MCAHRERKINVGITLDASTTMIITGSHILGKLPFLFRNRFEL